MFASWAAFSQCSSLRPAACNLFLLQHGNPHPSASWALVSEPCLHAWLSVCWPTAPISELGCDQQLIPSTPVTRPSTLKSLWGWVFTTRCICGLQQRWSAHAHAHALALGPRGLECVPWASCTLGDLPGSPRSVMPWPVTGAQIVKWAGEAVPAVAPRPPRTLARSRVQARFRKLMFQSHPDQPRPLTGWV